MPYSKKYTTWYGSVRRFWAVLLDLVAPPRSTEHIVRTLTLARLWEMLPQGDESLSYRTSEVTALVWELKYRSNERAIALAGAFAAEQLLSIASEELETPLLLPVPMHESRMRERGNNHTELLCESALKHVEGFEYAPKMLTRIRVTPLQQGLPRKTRLKNVRGSMQANTRVCGRVCVVVDDVTTTGATFEEARRALKAAGAAKVYCVALARA